MEKIIEELNTKYDLLSRYKPSKKFDISNPHVRSIRALSTFDEIIALYERLQRSLEVYKNNFIDKSNPRHDQIENKSFVYIRTDYNALILAIHRYSFYLIKVFDCLPQQSRRDVKTSGFTEFCKSIEDTNSPLYPFYEKTKNSIGVLEYELALYRDLYIEHYDRISTDWKTISPTKKEFFVRHIPQKRLDENEIKEMRNFLKDNFGKEAFPAIASPTKSVQFLIENRYRLLPKERDYVKTKYILRCEYKSPLIEKLLIAMCDFTFQVVQFLEDK